MGLLSKSRKRLLETGTRSDQDRDDRDPRPAKAPRESSPNGNISYTPASAHSVVRDYERRSKSPVRSGGRNDSGVSTTIKSPYSSQPRQISQPQPSDYRDLRDENRFILFDDLVVFFIGFNTAQ
jgi:hypothetical protein